MDKMMFSEKKLVPLADNVRKQTNVPTRMTLDNGETRDLATFQRPGVTLHPKSAAAVVLLLSRSPHGGSIAACLSRPRGAKQYEARQYQADGGSVANAQPDDRPCVRARRAQAGQLLRPVSLPPPAQRRRAALA